MSYKPAYPHAAIEAVAPAVFIACGSLKMTPVMRISRNMVIVHHAGELTLANPIRLNTAGEARLNALGKGQA